MSTFDQTLTAPVAGTDPGHSPSEGDAGLGPVGHGFSLVSRRPVPSLDLTLEHYRHSTGADHFHLANDDPHRAFAVTFRTIPDDSTGLPHILEHLVLCGSERYPVRDPFFLMLRRSLQTFMNAMTGKDATYYPFSTLVKKDFDNLLGIYLDAVFKPNLNPLDFAQEGYRVAPEDDATAAAGVAPAADPEEWAFKGVVYNEMKGATGNADWQMYDAAARALVPSTPYRFNSGGEPADIPSLSYDDLVDFHAKHYCAANACITTYGDLDIEELHARFDPYLRHRPGASTTLPTPEPAVGDPRTVDVPVPLEAGQDARDVTVASLAWRHADTRDLRDVLLGELLEHLLLGHAGAPLRHALESSGLGRALGHSGFGSFGTNGFFTADLKGIDPEDYPRFEPLVMKTLENVREHGFGDGEVEAALHQLELSRRVIGGDRFPFGLDLCLRAADAWRQDTDPLEQLDQDAALAALRERVQAPGFWADVLDEWFLENPHRALLLARPDGGFNAEREADEKRRLGERIAASPPSELDALATGAAALAERQAEEDDVSVLPELLLADVPAERPWPEGRAVAEGVAAFRTGTNGILHQVAAIPLGPLSERELDLLPLLSGSIGRLGVGDLSYTEQAARLNALCGSLSAWTDLRTDPDQPDLVRGFLFVEVYGLARRSAEFAGLIRETLDSQRFDEHARLLELVEQGVVRYQSQVNWQGNELAQKAATRGFGGRAGLSHRMSGLGRMAWLKSLAGRSKANGAMAGVAAELDAFLDRLGAAPIRLALIGDTAEEPGTLQDLLRAWDGRERAESFDTAALRVPMPAPVSDGRAPRAYTTATPVNYMAMALPAVPMGHPDSAPLAVGARYLANNFLHTRIREKGGAYGSRATYASNTATFLLSSYRDPRFADTLADMREGLAMLATVDDDERLLREAILGVIAGLDRPGSPAGEGRRRFVGDLVHHGPETLNAFRARVLDVTMGDVRRVAAEWLVPARATLAAVTSAELLEASGLEWERESI